MTSLFAIVALLLINGFFVAAEFALVKAKAVRIETLATEGSASARLTVAIQQNLEAYLAACQLGITMASLGLGWVGEPAVAALLEPLFSSMGMPEEVLHTVAFLVGFLLFSSLHIVIGEQVPKTFAIRQAEQVSLWVAYPLYWSYMLVWPLNWLLNWASRSLLSLFNVEEATHGDVYTEGELKDLVSNTQEHGSMEQEKAQMLHNLLDFDQQDLASVMIPRKAVTVLDTSQPGTELEQIILQSKHSRYPLIDTSSGEIHGVILSKSILRAMHSTAPFDWTRLSEHVVPALVVPDSLKIVSMFEMMRARKSHMALVVDEYGDFVGIVTLEDLLEEIVGDIEDETDGLANAAPIEVLGVESWRVSGLASLIDVQRATGLSAEASLDANSISGLLIDRLQRLPSVGDVIREGEFTLCVSELDQRRIKTIDIEKCSNDEYPDPTETSK